MLLFKKRFLPAIRSGEKTQTIRLWKHRMMRSGQRSYIPGVGPIQIEHVEEVELDQLTDADAAPDGFATIEALREEIRSLYSEKIALGYRTYRIAFRVGEPAVPVAKAPGASATTRAVDPSLQQPVADNEPTE